MGIVQKLTHERQPMLILLLRVALGLILLLKGLFFLSHAGQLESMIHDSRFGYGTAYLVGYITFAHLFGGSFIVLGLLTRWMVALQLPILAGAVLFFNRAGALFGVGSEFLLTLLVLILLIFFLYEGGGPVSMDRYLKKHKL